MDIDTKCHKLSWEDWWSLGLGLGKMPVAPGTWGSLLGIVLALPLARMPLILSVIWILFWTGFSCWTCDKTYKKFGRQDHKSIVCDEVVGMMWTYMFMPLSITKVFLGFLLFRLLDICKPPPINWLESDKLGSFGVMADDMAAGLLSYAILYLLT